MAEFKEDPTPDINGVVQAGETVIAASDAEKLGKAALEAIAKQVDGVRKRRAGEEPPLHVTVNGVPVKEALEPVVKAFDDYLANITPSQAVRILVAALGIEEEDLKGLQINPRGTILLLKNDFSSKTVRFDALKRKVVQS